MVGSSIGPTASKQFQYNTTSSAFFIAIAFPPGRSSTYPPRSTLWADQIRSALITDDAARPGTTCKEGDEDGITKAEPFDCKRHS